MFKRLNEEDTYRFSSMAEKKFSELSNSKRKVFIRRDGFAGDINPEIRVEYKSIAIVVKSDENRVSVRGSFDYTYYGQGVDYNNQIHVHLFVKDKSLYITPNEYSWYKPFKVKSTKEERSFIENLQDRLNEN